MYIRLDIILHCDGQTDGQKWYINIALRMLALPTRDKNAVVSLNIKLFIYSFNYDTMIMTSHSLHCQFDSGSRASPVRKPHTPCG